MAIAKYLLISAAVLLTAHKSAGFALNSRVPFSVNRVAASSIKGNSPACLPLARKSALPQLKMQEKGGEDDFKFQFPGIQGSYQLFGNPVLALGDAAVFLLFAAIGRGNHGTAEGNALTTALPFLMAWFLLAPALGAYSGRASASIKQAALIALPALLVTVPTGVAIRGALEGYTPAAPFWVVSIVATSVLMTSWRVGFSQVAVRVEGFVNAIVSDKD